MQMRMPACLERIKRKRKKRVRGDQEGQSIVEMALVTPILLLLLIAVIDLARAFDAYIVLTNAVREGARFGSRELGLTEWQIQELVAVEVTGSGTNVTNMADFAPEDVAVIKGTRAVTVTATYEYDLWFGGAVGFDTLQLEKTSAMPIMRP
jgi:Flp pilus assembly protein TadG